MAKHNNRNIRQVRADARALGDLSTEATDAIRQLVQEVRDETLELVEAGRKQVSEFGEAAEDSIRGKPIRAVCIALGIGCFIGLVLGRR